MCDSVMGSMGPMGMSGMEWFMPGMFLAVLLAGMVGVALVLAGTMRRQAVPAVQSEPATIAAAKERYARGEIDHAELDRILDTLLRTEGRR